MKQRGLSVWVAGGVLGVAIAVAPACAVDQDQEETDAESIELASAASDGARLFNQETFGGNGRTCATCHPSTGSGTGTLSVAQVNQLFRANPTGPLFRHDGADVIGGNTFNRIRAHATLLIQKSLPANVSLVGSTARSVTLARGIPTTFNTPALDPVLMYDGRNPTLQDQALGAINGHAQATAVTALQLDNIAAFQQTLFSCPDLVQFARRGVTPKMPFGRTESEKRGRRAFITDDQDDPNMVGEGPTQFCGGCHSGPMLNRTSRQFGEVIVPGVPTGTRFFSVLVSELNTMGNPVLDFEFHNPDGTVTTVATPDPGRALVTGALADVNAFKINSLWGIEDTAPYFHDNSAKDLKQLMDHYGVFLRIVTGGVVDLSAQDKADIIAYMKLL